MGTSVIGPARPSTTSATASTRLPLVIPPMKASLRPSAAKAGTSPPSTTSGAGDPSGFTAAMPGAPWALKPKLE